MTQRVRQQGRGGRAAGWTAAWAVVFALVLQIVMTSALVASTLRVSADDPFAVLCLGDTDHAADATGADRAKAAVHCLACFARADALFLPPPPATPVIDRIAIEIEYRAVLRSAFRAEAYRPPQQPRAPPHFA